MLTQFISAAVSALWVALIIYWIVSARRTKKNVGTRSWVRGAWIRVAFVAIALWLVGSTGVLSRKTWFAADASGAIWSVAGFALCAAGVAFAVWARVHLGRNWSSFPTLKEGHELVTSGPYRIVRHPIYAGILTAIIGSIIASGPVWIIVLAVFGVTFVWRVHAEEQLMVQEFPRQYPEYKKRTKALIPFIW